MYSMTNAISFLLRFEQGGVTFAQHCRSIYGEKKLFNGLKIASRLMHDLHKHSLFNIERVFSESEDFRDLKMYQ